LKATGFVPPITSGARAGNGTGHSFPGGSKAIDFGVAGNNPERIALYLKTMRAALGDSRFKDLWFEDSSDSDLMKAVNREIEKIGPLEGRGKPGTYINGASTGPHIHMAQYKYGGITNDDIRNSIKVDSDQLELDYYDTGYDNQTEEMLGKVVVDTLDQDEVELDKYATEGVI
jgi:hypothetical protein